MGTKQLVQKHYLQKAEDLGLLDELGAPNYTLTAGNVWPQLFLQGPPKETNVPSLHACLADLASPPIRYGLHQRGKNVASVSANCNQQMERLSIFKRAERGRLCNLQVGEVDSDP